MAKVKGSTFEAREQKRQAIRDRNRLNWARQQGQQAAWSGTELVRAACQAAKAASHRLTETGQRLLAQGIAQAVDAVNTPENRKV